MHTLKNKIKLHRCSHAVIMDVIFSITPEEFRSLYEVQNSFWKERLKKLASDDFFQKSMKPDLSSFADHEHVQHIDNIEKVIGKICCSPDGQSSDNSEKGFTADMSNKTKCLSGSYKCRVKTAYYQYLSRKITSSDNAENLKRTRKLILFMSQRALEQGLVELDFIFLGERGVREPLFQWLLIVVTSALYWLRDPNKNYNGMFETMTEYEKIVYIGLSAVQAEEDTSEIEEKLLQV